MVRLYQDKANKETPKSTTADSFNETTVFGEMIDLLDLIRLSTLEVVESIKYWREKRDTRDPFKWNDLNYLLKIPTDLDFLQKVRIVNYLLQTSLIHSRILILFRIRP